MQRTIQSTTDYKKFTLMASNRRVYKPHVKRLVAVFELFPRYSEWLPILINEKFEIADGQHRFHALQELGLPIFFLMVEGLTIEDARRLNAGAKPWSPMDYAQCFSDGGKASYTLYIELKKKYHLNHDILMRVVAQKDSITGEAFKQGRLTAPNKKASLQSAKYISELQDITDNVHRGLAFALMDLMGKGTDVKALLSQVDKHYKKGNRIEPYKDTEEYLRELRRIAK